MSIMSPLPVPNFFDAERVDQVWRVPYQQRATEAEAWAKQQQIQPAAGDRLRVCLLAIDVQNTFCLPGFELFVAGRSGRGAVDDNVRLCQFIYQNLGTITDIAATLDTHTAMQVFHAVFWVDEAGQHPSPLTTIKLSDVERGVWKPNPAVAYSVTDGNYRALEDHARHYVKQLTQDGRYPLTIWSYHAILGGISHALVAAVEEAIFFHSVARSSQTHFEQKGSNPLTENYSALQPEVLVGANGQAIAHKNTTFLEKLLAYDVLIVAGQAKSHCVAWTVEDLLTQIKSRNLELAKKVYLLEDCTSPVVGQEVDFTDQADAAFERFADAGMHLVQSSEAIASWLPA